MNRGTIEASIVQSSRKSLLLRTFRPRTLVTMMKAAKQVHHLYYSHTFILAYMTFSLVYTHRCSFFLFRKETRTLFFRKKLHPYHENRTVGQLAETLAHESSQQSSPTCRESLHVRLPTSEAPEARCPTKLAAVETLFSQAQPAKGEHQKSV